MHQDPLIAAHHVSPQGVAVGHPLGSVEELFGYGPTLEEQSHNCEKDHLVLVR